MPQRLKRILRIVLPLFCMEGLAVVSPVFAAAISQAVLCESMDGEQPQGSGVIFSERLEHVTLYTRFDTVNTSTHVYHRWYHRDRLMANRKLVVRTPRWATYSTVQLRKADKGPWRVDVVSAAGEVLKSLRFSIVE